MVRGFCMVANASVRWAVVCGLCCVAACSDGGSDKPGGGAKEVENKTPAVSSSGTEASVAPNKSAKVQPAKTNPSASARAATPAKPRSTKKVRYAKVSDEDVTKWVTPQLAGATMAHPPFRGPFGPAQDSIVVITKKANEDFSGFVLVVKGDKVHKHDLPVLQESWPGVSVEAMGFVSECDGDLVEELVVISKHRSASGAATVATVIDFDGDGFRRMTDVENLVAKAKTVSDVRTALSERTFTMRIDGVPFRVLPTVKPQPLHDRLAKLMGVKAKSHTDTEVAFAYSEKKGREPAEFSFSFNGAKVLQKVTVRAADAKPPEGGEAEPDKEPGAKAAESPAKAAESPELRNPTGAKLVAWLRKDVGAGKTNGSKTTWEHAGWVFELDAVGAKDGSKEAAHYTVEMRPAK